MEEPSTRASPGWETAPAPDVGGDWQRAGLSHVAGLRWHRGTPGEGG